jgi:hypothetical protein
MANKKIWLGVLVITTLALGVILTSCFSSGTARETLPQTAVTIQRVRAASGFFSAEDDLLNTPMQIFIDHNEPLELANGASTTILVNNGEHVVYAVLGNLESKSVRFTAKSQTIAVNVFAKKSVLGKITLEIEVK